MIVSLVVIFLLIVSFFSGYKKGLVLTLLRIVGFVAIYLFARILTSPVTNWLGGYFPKFSTTDNTTITNHLQTNFYLMIVFAVLFFVGGILVRSIIRVINSITKLPIIHQVNSLIGGLLSVVLMFIFIFIGLTILSVWPNEKINAAVSESVVAQKILTNTPTMAKKMIVTNESKD
ncbi:CvpA family protein [Dellaglioa sp. L3N]